MEQEIKNAFDNIAEAIKRGSDGNEKITEKEINNLLKYKNEILSYFNLNNIKKPVTQDIKEKGVRLFSFIANVLYEADLDANKATKEITMFLFGKEITLNDLFNEFKEKLEFNDIDLAEIKIFFKFNIKIDDVHKLYNDYLSYKKFISEISQRLNLKENKWTGVSQKIPISKINYEGEENEGIEGLPFDEKYTMATDKLRKIVQDTSNITDSSKFLEQITPEKDEIYSVEQIENFLNIFGEAILQRYRERASREWQCSEMTAIMVLIGKKFGINMYKVKTDYHTFAVVRIKNIGREGFSEYRIDPTANQYSKQFIGFAITPRIKNIGENYEKLETPIYGKNYCKGKNFQGDYLPEIISDFYRGERFSQVSSDDINNILKFVNNKLTKDKVK